MENEFENYYKNNIQSGDEKLTIILGTGFHKSIGLKNELSCWDLLFTNLNTNSESKSNYLLDFERFIIDKPTINNATKSEKEKLKELSKVIKDRQSEIDDKALKNYPLGIFNPEIVSDVIILNFDEIAEAICKRVLNCEISKFQYVEIDKNSSEKTKIHQTTRFRNIIFPNGKSIRFWHPHGSISEPTEIILSARSYASHIANIERLRKHSKLTGRSKNNKTKTWYDKITHQTVLILGASISPVEWDLWSAFVNRERNFSKNDHIQFRKPIFQMRESNANKIEVSCDRSNEIWFKPLFDEKLNFNTQWEILNKIIGS